MFGLKLPKIGNPFNSTSNTEMTKSTKPVLPEPIRSVKLIVPHDFDDSSLQHINLPPGVKIWQPRETKVHDHGFVKLIDFMGDDIGIEEAARLSYTGGTRAVSKTRGLLRYLMRMKHTSPSEMTETKWHIKCPIFVARQWVRHRTVSMNEESARYSVLSNDFYLPNLSDIKPQSKDNKQGRAGEVTATDKEVVIDRMKSHFTFSYQEYEKLLGEHDDEFSEEFPGIARESARAVLPTAIYTQFYWKINLHNLFHFLQLRMDPHAQKEIRDYAIFMADMIKDLFPISWEAFEDYRLFAKGFSRMEMDIVREAFNQTPHLLDAIREVLDNGDYLETEFGLSVREAKEFLAKVS